MDDKLDYDEVTDKCTCENCYDPHTCPYQEDVNDDDEYTCTCCPYCTSECVLAI